MTGEQGHPKPLVVVLAHDLPELDAAPVEAPRQASAQEQPCELVDYHAPRPVITEHHHSRPVYLQNRVYGRIRFGADLWVCSNCHEAIHAWLYWLLGERRKPAYIGRAAKAEAERAFEWYLAAVAERDAAALS